MKRLGLFLPLLMLLTPQFVLSDAIVIDFDGLADSGNVTAQFPALTFTNATVLSAGLSLNEFEFPPHSGTNVVFDDGGAISIAFVDSIVNFGAFFNYFGPITVQAFDVANNVVGTVSSAFNSNLGLSGDAGSSPNEFLSLAVAGGFTAVTISGNALGGSFTMDDMSYTASGGATPLPAPSSLLPFVTGIAWMVFVRRRQRHAA